MQLTFIIKTQQLSLKDQQHIRYKLSVSRVNSALALPTHTCVGEQKLTVQMVCHGHHHQTLSQVTGWGKEQHQECYFSLPLEAELFKWALPESVMWLCWWRGGFAQRNLIFSKPKREREQPHGCYDVRLTPL